MFRKPSLTMETRIYFVEQTNSRCSGRHECFINIPDTTLHQIQPCPKDMLAYLEADYTCRKGTTTTLPVLPKNSNIDFRSPCVPYFNGFDIFIFLNGSIFKTLFFNLPRKLFFLSPNTTALSLQPLWGTSSPDRNEGKFGQHSGRGSWLRKQQVSVDHQRS